MSEARSHGTRQYLAGVNIVSLRSWHKLERGCNSLQRYDHAISEFLGGCLFNFVVFEYVWEEDNRDKPVIVKRFFVREELVAINGDVYRPNLIPYRNEYQEIN